MPLSYNISAAFLGLISHHLLFIHGEHHEEGPLWLGFCLLVQAVFLIAQIAIYKAQVREAVIALTWVMASFATALFGSILIYRIFFHRLRSFPGPFLAKTTKLWHVWKVAPKSDNFRQLDSLHHTYGDFVRTGGNLIPSYFFFLPRIHAYCNIC